MTKHAEGFTLEPGVMRTPTLPSTSHLTRPFWDAAAEGRLLLPRCKACGRHFFRPEVACTHCFATDWQWVEASGRGTLYSHSVVHRAPAPGFAVPFVLAVVELEEGPMMFSNLVGCDLGGVGGVGGVGDADALGALGAVRIGMALKVRFEQVAAAVWLPRFEAA
jgi:uncharacterized OB-fold protein